jgi:hypothetical protein
LTRAIAPAQCLVGASARPPAETVRGPELTDVDYSGMNYMTSGSSRASRQPRGSRPCTRGFGNGYTQVAPADMRRRKIIA